MRTVR